MFKQHFSHARMTLDNLLFFSDKGTRLVQDIIRYPKVPDIVQETGNSQPLYLGWVSSSSNSLPTVIDKAATSNEWPLI